MDYDSAKTYFSADEKRLEREIIDTRLFQNVLQQARTGHRILMRCDHNGQGRIKVKNRSFRRLEQTLYDQLCNV